MRDSSRGTPGNFLEELCIRKSGNRPHQRDFSQRKKTTSRREGSARTNTHFSQWTQSSNYSLNREHEDGVNTWVVEEEQAMSYIQEGGHVGGCCWSTRMDFDAAFQIKIWCPDFTRDSSVNTPRVSWKHMPVSGSLSFVQLFLDFQATLTLPKTYDDTLRMLPLFRATLSPQL